MWKNSVAFDGVTMKSYCFACPCICSPNVPFDENLISIIEGNDAVCRLSVRSVEHLRCYLTDLAPVTDLVLDPDTPDDVLYSIWQTIQAQKRAIDQNAPGRVLLPAGKRIFFVLDDLQMEIESSDRQFVLPNLAETKRCSLAPAHQIKRFSKTHDIISLDEDNTEKNSSAVEANTSTTTCRDEEDLTILETFKENTVNPHGSYSTQQMLRKRAAGRFVAPYCFDDFVLTSSMFMAHTPVSYERILGRLTASRREAPEADKG